ncbi:rCG33195 [Rattus norvegicus]|uniref:RCG33195 n=1 Tax=Rattus norvegicus TaxID=10116 RepID=A6HK87_RAT|nr:rCG33195 [Rattus norvegicus]
MRVSPWCVMCDSMLLKESEMEFKTSTRLCTRKQAGDLSLPTLESKGEPVRLDP